MTNEDAINREDALKLIYDFKEKHTEDREKHPINYGTLLDLIRLIRWLPSVTQKHNYCASCKHNTDTYNEICLECEYERYEPVTQKPIECDDAISRQAVLDGLKGCMCEDWVKTLFATMVKQLPSVTQKSETGHWINLEKKYKGQVLPFWGRYGCSKCGGYGEGTFNYCPNCGAKMESDI